MYFARRVFTQTKFGRFTDINKERAVEERGKIYLVATPIGNLSDMSVRAIDTLKNVDIIACEDTRNTIRLLNHFDIKAPLTSYHEYNKIDKAYELCEKVKSALHNDKLKVSVQLLKNDEISSVITVSEESRRMQEMMKQYGMMGTDLSMLGGEGETLVLNANHPLVKGLLENNHEDLFDIICEQLYDLASISHSPLSPERMTAFIKRSNELMLKLK